MAYTKNYPNGWKSGEIGNTPITPDTLNHIEDGIKNAHDLIAQSTANMATSVKKSIAAGTSCTISFSPTGRRSAIITVMATSSGKYATYIYEGYGGESNRQNVTPITSGNVYFTVTKNDAQGITITPSDQVTGAYDVGVLMVLGNPPTIT